MIKTLVIGYGNMLRCDDGAGPHAAERIAELHPSVDCISCTELAPELAEVISHYNRIVFVDAGVGSKHLRWNMLQPRMESAPRGPQSHALTAQHLIELSIHLYNRCPQFIELVEIPAYDFDFAEQLSPLTTEMVERFVELFSETLSWTNIQELQLWTDRVSIADQFAPLSQRTPAPDSSLC